MLIDSHCHLNHARIQEAGTPSELVRRANESGIGGLVTICCRITEEAQDLIHIAKAHDNVWCSIGTHPHDAGNEAEKALSEDDICEIAEKEQGAVIGIGETGLDYFYNYATPQDQEESFRKHIRVAKALDLPLIIHTRDAEEDTMRILEDEGACDGQMRVLMHCFSSNEWLARQSIENGFYLSFSGMVTFKRNQWLRDIAKLVPQDRILVETDAPFLAPEPHRGKTCEPAFVRHTAQCLADTRGVDIEAFSRQTTDNFFRLFHTACYIE